MEKKKFNVHVELDFIVSDEQKVQCFERFSRIAKSYSDSKFEFSVSQKKDFDWFKPL